MNNGKCCVWIPLGFAGVLLVLFGCLSWYVLGDMAIGPEPIAGQSVLPNDLRGVSVSSMRVGDSGWVSDAALIVDENYFVFLNKNVMLYPQSDKRLVKVLRVDNGWEVSVPKDMRLQPAVFWSDRERQKYVPVVKLKVE